MSLPAPKVWATYLLKKALHWRTKFFGKIYAGMFHMGTNDQIMQVGGKISQMHFPVT